MQIFTENVMRIKGVEKMIDGIAATIVQFKFYTKATPMSVLCS